MKERCFFASDRTKLICTSFNQNGFLWAKGLLLRPWRVDSFHIKNSTSVTTLASVNMTAFDDVCILPIRAIVPLPINAPPGLWGERHKPIRQRTRRTQHCPIKAEFQWQTLNNRGHRYKRYLYFSADICQCGSNHKISKKRLIGRRMEGVETRRGRVHVCVSPGSQRWMESSTARWSKRLGHGAGSLADEQQGLEVVWGYVRPTSIFLGVNIQSPSSTASFVTLLSSKPTGKSAKCASISGIKAWGLEWIQQINNNL